MFQNDISNEEAQFEKLKLYLSLPFSYAFYIKSAHLKYGRNKKIRIDLFKAKKI